jgi:hypothetical protein
LLVSTKLRSLSRTRGQLMLHGSLAVTGESQFE